MREDYRQFYLSALGVSSWYARRALPGAAPSPAFDFGPNPEPEVADPAPAQRSEPAAAPFRAPRQAEGRRGMESVRELLDDSPSQLQTKAVPQSDSEAAKALSPHERVGGLEHEQGQTTSKVVGEAQSIEVRALIWFGPHLNLAADVSADTSMAMQRSLGMNIMRALSQQADDALEFQWPVFSNPAVPGNDAQGFESVCSRLLGHAVSDRWLFLGAGVRRAFQRQLDARDQKLWMAEDVTLATLASEGGRKRELWRQLQLVMADSPLPG